MTRQQINLFQDCLIDRPEPWQSRQAWLVLLIVLVLCTVVSLFSFQQISRMAGERDELQRQINAQEQSVETLEAQYPEANKSVLLEERLARLELEVERQREALSYFSERKAPGNESIVESLEGLAGTSFRGLWLNRIHFAKSGEAVVLTGTATSAERIPDYLARLSEQSIFGGRAFSHLQLTRVEKAGDLVDFNLASDREGL